MIHPVWQNSFKKCFVRKIDNRKTSPCKIGLPVHIAENKLHNMSRDIDNASVLQTIAWLTKQIFQA
jgi:hypothetical protein